MPKPAGFGGPPYPTSTPYPPSSGYPGGFTPFPQNSFPYPNSPFPPFPPISNFKSPTPPVSTGTIKVSEIITYVCNQNLKLKSDFLFILFLSMSL